MSWEKLYKDRWMEADEAIEKVVKSGDTIAWDGCLIVRSVCKSLFKAVKEEKLTDITAIGQLVMENLPFGDPELAKGLRYKSIFYGGYERQGVAAKNTTYIPMVYSNMTRMYEMLQPDVAILHLTPPDAEGYCNIGCFSSGTVPSAVKYAKRIIAGINPNLPRVYGTDMNIHVSKIDAFVDNTLPLPLYPVARPTEIDQTIGNFILEQVPDGACIQLGIGGMPNALGYGLRAKKHLGIHTEMLTGSMVDLIKEGVVDNSQKGYMPGITACGFTLGEQVQYDFVNNNPNVHFLAHELINDPYNIAKNDNFISVNNALEVDLKGAVCADTIGFRQFSGVGGQIDFVRGARMSKGGKSFIALESTFTAKDGTKKSHIVLNLAPGAQVTTLRSEVMYIVTEYGCVNLWGQDEPTRAKMLISIAHPDFRDELTFQAKKAGLIY